MNGLTPMNGSLLLDTNAVIALFAGEAAVQSLLSRADETFIPSIVLGELYYGAHKSGRREENVARLEEFAAAIAVLQCDAGTARFYGQVKNRLRAKGRPIPENDLWIAALALQHELTLASRDQHFEEVERLRVAEW